MAAVVQPSDRLLPGKAALRERDVRAVEPGLGGEDRLVELLAPGGNARLDPRALELFVVERHVEIAVEHFDRARQLTRQTVRDAEHEHRDVLLGLDLALRREARAHETRAHGLAELRLGQEQKVVRAATPDAQRRDDASLRGQQQRRKDVRVLLDVVREHPLQELDGVRDRGRRRTNEVGQRRDA